MKYKISLISITLGITSVIGIIYQNYRLALMYNNISSGKTKTLFGLTELAQIDIHIYLGIVSIVGLILGCLAIRNEDSKLYSKHAICINITGFVLLFIKLWKYLS